MEYRVTSPDGRKHTYGSRSDHRAVLDHAQAMGWSRDGDYTSRTPPDVPKENIRTVYQPRYKRVDAWSDDHQSKLERQGRIVCYIVRRDG